MLRSWRFGNGSPEKPFASRAYIHGFWCWQLRWLTEWDGAGQLNSDASITPVLANAILRSPVAMSDAFAPVFH